MSQQYHQTPSQNPYNYFGHQSSPSVPESPHGHSHEPPHHGLPQVTLPPSHPMRPLPTTRYVSTHEQQTFASRTSMLLTSQAETVAPPGSYPVYAPTANLYYNHNHASNLPFSNDFQQHQHPESSGPSPIHVQTQPSMEPAHTSASQTLPAIAPMPPRHNGNTSMVFGNGAGFPQSEEKPVPSHVVGAQGRRGILPSAAGRPPAPICVDLNSHPTSPPPTKGPDGKYGCLHCDKTYLHAKHLKRHLLRHTGNRPYSCGLCKDSFTRSDILKRHFTKCSTRRGNPTGLNHLALSRASKKAREQRGRDSREAGTPTITDHVQIPNHHPTSMDPTFDFNSLDLNQTNYGGTSNQASRSSSVTRSQRNAGSQSNRPNFGMVSASGYESTGHITPDSITTSGAATPYSFPHEQRTIQFSENGSFPHTSNGDLTYLPANRPPTSATFGSHGSLPHIVGQDHSRGYHADWPSLHHYSQNEEYGNGHHHSGASTPLERDKNEPDFSDIPLSRYQLLNRST